MVRRVIGGLTTSRARMVENRTGAIFTKLGLEAAPDDHRRVLAVLEYLRSS